jgi:hypothetical protein
MGEALISWEEFAGAIGGFVSGLQPVRRIRRTANSKIRLGMTRSLYEIKCGQSYFEN